MDDLIGNMKEKGIEQAKEFAAAKIREEAEKRGLGGFADQATGFLGLGNTGHAPQSAAREDSDTDASAEDNQASDNEQPSEGNQYSRDESSSDDEQASKNNEESEAEQPSEEGESSEVEESSEDDDQTR